MVVKIINFNSNLKNPFTPVYLQNIIKNNNPSRHTPYAKSQADEPPEKGETIYTFYR